MSHLLASLLLLAPAESADYRRDIKPILMARCASCHGSLQQKAGLRLDAASLIRKGSKNGPVVVPGKADQSLLLDAVTGKDRPRMPPEKDGPALTEKQIGQLRAWIEQGAKMPEEAIPEDPLKHWAFRPPVKSPAGDSIDDLLDLKRRQKGVVAAPEAGRETLLRRLHLDLTGLPPTRDELAAALADMGEDWYERMVERLLASPAHGERWARHWMDVWRYSDWYGRRAVPDVWNSAPQVFRWRDWIVRSVNTDKGYDRMVMEMLAGDEIAPDDEAARDATGYLARNWYALNPNQWMRDNVEHVGKAFLGLTFNCAHCHDHKYDPISHEEYFRFRAFFEPLGLRQDRVPGEGDPGAFQKYDYSQLRKVVMTGAVRVFDENPGAKTLFYNAGDERDLMKGKPPAEPGAPAFLRGDRLKIEPVALPETVAYPGMRADFRMEDLARLEAEVKAGKDSIAPARLAAYRARIAAEDAKQGGSKEAAVLARLASKAERLANLRAAEQRLAVAEIAEKAAAGDAMKLKKAQAEVTASKAVVAAATKSSESENAAYTPLSPVYPKSSTGRRKALAQWLASRDNPLPARVAVNHIWRHYFGRPLVETVADFGRNGAKPTQPELLDWLAVEMMDNGWSMKAIHRRIVLSRAYRQSALAKPQAADPDNVLLWRFPSRRLDAESVRDSILFVSGQLDRAPFGPPLDNVKDALSPRRSIYFSVYPEDGGQLRFLELFDPPDPCDCYKRSTSVVPQQALALTNSRLLLDASRLAARPLATLDDGKFLKAAFLRMLSRAPTEEEFGLCREFLAKQEALFRADKSPPPASAGVPPSSDPKQRARESLVRVLFSHDDFVTLR